MVLTQIRRSQMSSIHDDVWAGAPVLYSTMIQIGEGCKSRRFKDPMRRMIHPHKAPVFCSKLRLAAFFIRFWSIVLAKIPRVSDLCPSHFLDGVCAMFSTQHRTRFTEGWILLSTIVTWVNAVIVVAVEKFRVMTSINALQNSGLMLLGFLYAVKHLSYFKNSTRILFKASGNHPRTTKVSSPKITGRTTTGIANPVIKFASHRKPNHVCVRGSIMSGVGHLHLSST